MEYKISKSMADTDMEAVINGADLDYIVSAGKYLPKLLSTTGELNLVKTVPTEIVKELLLIGGQEPWRTRMPSRTQPGLSG
jgi:hypothetical protein